MKPFSITRLTPSGRGGIGSLLLTGPGTADAFCACFRFPDNRVLSPSDLISFRNIPLYGRFFLNETGTSREEIVVRIESPEEIEINSHGGEAVRAAVIRRLTAAGGSLVPDKPPQWETAPQSGICPNFRRNAEQLLPFARTERTARILLDQLNGAAERFLDTLPQKTPEEAEQALNRILAFEPVGKGFYTPPLVLLIGPVNAGKSSLLNSLLGFNRVLVDPMAGTTRDTVAAETIFGGFPIRLCDTAGIRNHAGLLEQKGIEKTVSLFDSASLIISVFDITAPSPDPPAEFAEQLRKNGIDRFPTKKSRLTLLNKADLPSSARNRFWDRKDELLVSPFLPETIERLRETILKLLFPVLPCDGEPVPLNTGERNFFADLLERYHS